MTKKLLEIERKRQLTGDAKELIKQLQDLGFKPKSSRYEINTYIILAPMSISCRRLSACGFASAMVLLRVVPFFFMNDDIGENKVLC